MGHIQRTVVINAPAEDVFALMADTGRYGEWVYHFAGLDEGPEILAEGDTFRWRVRLARLTLRPRSTVAQFDPPGLYIEEIRVGRLVRATLTKTVVRQKRRSQLGWTLNYRVIGGPLGVAADWLIGHRLAERAVRESLQGAKRVLETPRKAAATRPGARRRQTAVR
jgi:uncharacterized membrane protein